MNSHIPNWAFLGSCDIMKDYQRIVWLIHIAREEKLEFIKSVLQFIHRGFVAKFKFVQEICYTVLEITKMI